MEEFEYKGRWWLPKFPDYQIAGTIKFHPVQGASLELIGDDFTADLFELAKNRPQSNSFMTILSPRDRDIEIIWGYTESGDPATLYKCVSSGDTASRGYRGSRYSIQVIFIGHHFETYEDIIFDSLSIHYTYLEQWLGITGFSGGFTRPNKRKTISGQIKYKSPKRLKIRVNDFFISFNYSFYLSGDRFVDIQAEQKTYIEIIPDQRLHYDDYQGKVIYHIRNFLSLGLQMPILPLSIQGIIKVKRQEKFITIYHFIKGSTLSEKKRTYNGNMLFGYQDISDDFPNYLKNWFNKADKLKSVIDLYFGLLYIPSTYVYLEFLTLAQVLETYHRHMYNGFYMTPEQYESVSNKLIDAIPDEVDKSHRDKLVGTIKYAYEYSLNKRLKGIFDEVLAPYKETVEKLIENKNDFIRNIVNTRNYLTHYTEDPKHPPIIDPREQHAFVQ